MYGWCDKCRAVVVDGLCSKHGATRPISHINAVDIHPLSTFEKVFFNQRLKNLRLGDGIFLIYPDRMFRRKIVTLDRPLLEVKLGKNDIYLTPLVEGEVEGMTMGSLVCANSTRIARLSEVTKAFAEWELRANKNAIILFSGGKDSGVLADLLGDFKLKMVFVDTRLEFPETYRFIGELKRREWQIDIAKAQSSFFLLCNYNGYPGHGNRWCCKTQKFEPIARYLNEKYHDTNVLCFSGERRSEGIYRISQPFKKMHKHIPHQETVQPMLDWLALDIWIYTWAKQLPVNPVYEHFDRAGCWLCPFGLEYRIFLLQFTHPKLHKALTKIQKSQAIAKNQPKTRGRPPSCFEIHREPCTTMLDGKKVRTCDVYGHFFVNRYCFRCGTPEPSTTERASVQASA